MGDQQPLVIYHATCCDGFTAAWAVSLRYPQAHFYAAKHGTEPPDVTGRDVIMVDFCYKRPAMEKIRAACRSLVVLDHHKTAREDLTDLEDSHAHIVFDMERSGAMLAWNYFMKCPPPALVAYVQDRDLWQHKLPHTEEITRWIFSYPYTFGQWDALAKMLKTDFKGCVAEGAAILRSVNRQIDTLIENNLRRMTIGGYVVPTLNCTYVFASDAANKICASTGAPFGAAYSDDADWRRFSLRSIGEFDVSAIAKTYGGGGHRNAAGFSKPHGWDGDAAA